MTEDHKDGKTDAMPQDAVPEDAGPESASDATQTAADETAVSDAELVAELAEANARALRSQAELENFRKRMRREIEDNQKYASVPVLQELLPVVDDMERAIAAAEKSEDSAGLLAGVKMVEERLRNVLIQQGCQRIDAEGATFDPARHEAILMQPSHEHEPGTVMQVTKQGYQLHDRVLRPAQVIVAQQAQAQADS